MKFSRIFLAVSIFFPTLAFAQELRLVKNQPNKFFIEQYYVLASNPDVKYGLYQKYLEPSLELVERGCYKNNKKDSIWTRFDKKGRVTETCGYVAGNKSGIYKAVIYNGDSSVVTKEGRYTMGEMTGVWTFKNANGGLSYVYDSDKNKITAYGKNTDTVIVIDHNDTISTVIDTPAIHAGGLDTLFRLMEKNIRVPFVYPKNGRLAMSTQVYLIMLSFVVDENGKLGEFTVLRGNRKEYNDEALRALKFCDDGKWFPGHYQGHTVKIIETIPMLFNISYNNVGITVIRQ